MLFTCNYSTLEGQHLDYKVEANTFSQAETAFTQYAQFNINTGYHLDSIVKSHAQESRIKYNADTLRQQVRTTYSHEVIIFD